MSSNGTMHAVVMYERGGPEVLRYEMIPIPVPGNREVLIRVHAATVNHTDIFHRTGQFYIQKELPHILGMDVAGEIVALGKAVMAATGGRSATFVLDLVGKPTLQSSIDMLGRSGRIICTGALGGDVGQINIIDIIMKNATIRGSFGVIRQEDFEKILRLYSRGAFQPVIDSVLPLSEARAAHEKIESRQTFGKVILVPQEN